MTPSRTAIDGVPVFWLTVPGPLQAMLMFRVGFIDETLPMRGITHLVEHLALFGPMQNAQMANRMNGRVELHRTRFFASGTDDEVATFLADVTSNLGALPLDRLDSEKRILRTEAANKSGGSAKNIWSFRFGAGGPGVSDYEELGLRWLGPEQVADWGAANFTAGNAVLWLSGPPPAGLRLNLPSGPRRSLPAVTPVDVATPAVYQQGDRWVVLSMLGSRGTALAVGARVLDARVRDRLRNQQSLAYDVHASYQRLDARVAEVTAFADSLAHNARGSAEALVAVTRAMAEDGPEPEELASAIAERRRLMEDRDSAFGRLEMAAIEQLEGLEPKTAAELDAEAEALTPDSVAQAFRSAIGTSYLAVPTNVDMRLDGFTPVPAGNGKRINGTVVAAMPGAGHEDVIEYSEEGISVTSPDEISIGMRWQDVAVGLWWGEGRRVLIGSDGISINVVPAKWRNARALVEQMLASVPSERWVPMDDTEAPPGQKPQAAPMPAWMRAARLRRYLLALLIIADVVFGFWTMLGLVGLFVGETDIGSIALLIGFSIIFTLVMSATLGVVYQAGWARATSIVAGLAVCFSLVGAIIGIPIMIVAARLPKRPHGSSTAG